jgi:hypothetical protein
MIGPENPPRPRYQGSSTGFDMISKIVVLMPIRLSEYGDNEGKNHRASEARGANRGGCELSGASEGIDQGDDIAFSFAIAWVFC